MQIIRMPLNWIIFLTMPLWGGIALFITCLLDIQTSRRHNFIRKLLGSLWIWE